MPRGATVGTASLRRQAQLRALRSDLSLQDLRGNINTRLKRLDQGDYAAIILAAAGLMRANLTARISDYFSIEQVLPAAGQGALGIECKAENKNIISLITPLNHQPTYTCVAAERAFCRHLGGGCKLPVAAYAQIQQHELVLHGLVASLEGMPILRSRRVGHLHEAEKIGIRVAEELLQQGAEKILQGLR